MSGGYKFTREDTQRTPPKSPHPPPPQDPKTSEKVVKIQTRAERKRQAEDNAKAKRERSQGTQPQSSIASSSTDVKGGSAFGTHGDDSNYEQKRTPAAVKQDLGLKPSPSMPGLDFGSPVPGKKPAPPPLSIPLKMSPSPEKMRPIYDADYGSDQPFAADEDIEKKVSFQAAQGLSQIPQEAQKNSSSSAKSGGLQMAAAGYVGGRGIFNEDVKNSSSSSSQPRNPGEGDAFINGKESHNSTTDTLRPLFGIAPPQAVIPSRRDQVQSDLLFTDFSVVAPGNGLGVTNKMFLMEEHRDKEFVYREPMCEPRKYDGPSGLVVPAPLQFQNEITRGDRRMLNERAIAGAASAVLLEARAGEGSLNILGDDFGMFQAVSDKGLKRYSESPLEPINRLPKAWERVKQLPGFQWGRKKMRRLFDSERYPERFEPNIAMEGGPTLSQRNSLAVFPFPITSH